MTTKKARFARLLAVTSIAALSAGPALALTDQQVAAINSRVLDVVESCTFNPAKVPEGIRKVAAQSITDPRDAGDVAGSIILAAQSVTDSPSCLFAVGEGVTSWALTFGDSHPTAVSIGTTIGQVGKVPVINACVNTAGVRTAVGLACDPPTSDLFGGSARSHMPSFGSTGENPSRDDSSPN